RNPVRELVRSTPNMFCFVYFARCISLGSGFRRNDVVASGWWKSSWLASADMDALVAAGLHHRADHAAGEAVLRQQGRGRGYRGLRQDHGEADAAVEGAPHFLARHLAFALQPVEYRRQGQ